MAEPGDNPLVPSPVPQWEALQGATKLGSACGPANPAFPFPTSLLSQYFPSKSRGWFSNLQLTCSVHTTCTSLLHPAAAPPHPHLFTRACHLTPTTTPPVWVWTFQEDDGRPRQAPRLHPSHCSPEHLSCSSSRRYRFGVCTRSFPRARGEVIAGFSPREESHASRQPLNLKGRRQQHQRSSLFQSPSQPQHLSSFLQSNVPYRPQQSSIPPITPATPLPPLTIPFSNRFGRATSCRSVWIGKPV